MRTPSYPSGATPPDQLQAAFLALVPRIETHARITFRDVRCPGRRADQVAEAVALAWARFVRLAERGKDASHFPGTFAARVVQAVRCGRRLCGQERSTDALSPVARRRHGFAIGALPGGTSRSYEPLDGTGGGGQRSDAFAERLCHNTVTPVPEQAAFRIDWPAFFRSLNERDRGLVTFLALGHLAQQAAAQFQISPGRVSQLRVRWCQQWYARHGEVAPFLRRAQQRPAAAEA